MSTSDTTPTFTLSPALTLTLSLADTDTSEPLKETTSDESMPIEPDATNPKSFVATDRDSAAVTDTRPLTKLALSPANADSVRPALTSTSSVDRLTDSPE